jgi:hypothetical protein
MSPPRSKEPILMVRNDAKVFLLSSILFSAGVLGGCGGGYHASPRMADGAASAIAPVPDKAVIVFVRPSGYAGVIVPSLYVDGEFVGDIEASRRVVVPVAPGHHRILSAPVEFMTKACRDLEATVAANRVYYVEATVANGAALFAVHTSDGPKLKEWLATAPVERKLSGPVPAYAADDLAKCGKYAEEHRNDADADEKAKSTLGEADGFEAAQ